MPALTINSYYKAEGFAFDNLRFEIGTFAPGNYKIGSIELKKDDSVISFHIPRGNKNFDRESRWAFYKKAYEFF